MPIDASVLSFVLSTGGKRLRVLSHQDHVKGTYCDTLIMRRIPAITGKYELGALLRRVDRTDDPSGISTHEYCGPVKVWNTPEYPDPLPQFKAGAITEQSIVIA